MLTLLPTVGRWLRSPQARHSRPLADAGCCFYLPESSALFNLSTRVSLDASRARLDGCAGVAVCDRHRAQHLDLADRLDDVRWGSSFFLGRIVSPTTLRS